MARSKPIRRSRRLAREVLRVADGAFWLVLALAVVLGARPVAEGAPKLAALFLPHFEAQASVASPLSLWVAPAPRPVEPSPELRLSGRPLVAIVIDDLGGDAVHTRRAIQLPPDVALAFLPWPGTTPALARAAARAGHEVLVHVPMQAIGAASAGPGTLSPDLAPEENLRRLDGALARVPGFIGINNHEGSRFTADRAALDPVMARLAARRVFFFDSRTTPETQVIAAARAHGVETGARDVFLDDTPTIDTVDAQLRALEAKARVQGVAIAIGHPHEITLDAVAYWAAHRTGFRLVTLKEAMRKKTEMSLTLAGR